MNEEGNYMKNVTLEELLEAGCHFGHQVSRQNSKAREFIFEARDNIHIIDLEKTKEGLDDAAAFVKSIAQKNGTFLVLGTKRQAEGILREEQKRLVSEDVDGVHFILKRWIGGTFTNYTEVAKNYKKLKDITNRLKDEHEKAGYTKKEISEWEKERQKLEGFYGGIADMAKVPDVLFVIDTHLERVAVQEAIKMGVPVVGITDTNADPTIIDYPIPANDDAVGSLKLLIGHIFEAWIEGKKGAKEIAEAVAAEKKLEEEKEPKKVEPKVKEEAKEGEAVVAKKKETAAAKKPATPVKAKKATTKKKEDK